MFYNHEILTNRQYGVATVWLVATLGSKSNLKKVTRRAILDVDLQKACKTITEPEAPLALRLQGSLLFGVSRVFQQQCGYVLTDVTSLRDNMRSKVLALQDMEIDPDVGKARPDQLNLAEDPYFLPDFDIHFDLSAFGFSSEGSTSSRDGSSMLSLASSQSSLQVEEEHEEVGLNITWYSTPGAAIGAFDFPLGADTSSPAKPASRTDRLSSIFAEEPAIIENPVFDVDDDGFLRPTESGDFLDEGDLLPIEDAECVSGAGVSAHAEEDALPMVGEDEPLLNFDDDGDGMVLDDEPALPTAAPLIPLTPEPDTEDLQQGRQASTSRRPSEETSETAEAPQRRVRTVKPIQPDRETELSNRMLNEWNQNYLANMAAASRIMETNVARTNAKKNADFWISQQGIGNVASTFGADKEPHPLAIFSGQSLWDLLQGPQRGTKRSRSTSGEDERGSKGKRTRARTTSQEGVVQEEAENIPQFADDDGIIFQGSDFEVEPEVGRHAPPSLPDISSAMPWNLSVGGSRQSSAHPPGSGFVPRLSSSIGGIGMELGPPSALSRRGSRLTSASPLLGRGLTGLSRQSSHELGEPSKLISNDDDFADLDAQLGAGLDADFELYGPSATVDTQTAAQSQWVAATLENEAYNFLTFVSTKIQERAGHGGEGEQENVATEQEQSIMLDELLPPAQNSAVVAAQALLHVLALTTKGLLEVYQAEHFGEILISVASH